MKKILARSWWTLVRRACSGPPWAKLVANLKAAGPGAGRLRAQGSGYVWLPVNYAPPQ